MAETDDSTPNDAPKPGSIAAERTAGRSADWVRRSDQAGAPAHPPMAAAILMVSVVVLLVAVGLVSVL